MAKNGGRRIGSQSVGRSVGRLVGCLYNFDLLENEKDTFMIAIEPLEEYWLSSECILYIYFGFAVINI
jgi:hypothetical protein